MQVINMKDHKKKRIIDTIINIIPKVIPKFLFEGI